jgi:hypothetical protein
VEKQETAFYKRKRAKDGLTPHCKDCARQYTTAWNSINREAVAANTYEEFIAMGAAQGNACAICRRELRFGGPAAHGRASMDHRHRTGKLRAVLCGLCNTALGKFGDNPETLRAAADYLERFK